MQSQEQLWTSSGSSLWLLPHQQSCRLTPGLCQGQLMKGKQGQPGLRQRMGTLGPTNRLQMHPERQSMRSLGALQKATQI